MGHSAGGAFVQILLDHGFGAAGVALNSAPTEGVLVAPWSQLRASFPVLKSPANRHRAVGLTYEQWRYAFTNTFPEAESRTCTSDITCRRQAASSGTACLPTSSRAASDLGQLPERGSASAPVRFRR
jgi:hypothetical protein